MKRKANGEFKIEDDIPIPAGKHGHSKGYTDALRRLKKVGQSVLLPIEQQAASHAAYYALGKARFSVRAEGKGSRVWRIK
jgi:hypothetical protein